MREGGYSEQKNDDQNATYPAKEMREYVMVNM